MRNQSVMQVAALANGLLCALFVECAIAAGGSSAHVGSGGVDQCIIEPMA